MFTTMYEAEKAIIKKIEEEGLYPKDYYIPAIVEKVCDYTPDARYIVFTYATEDEWVEALDESKWYNPSGC